MSGCDVQVVGLANGEFHSADEDEGEKQVLRLASLPAGISSPELETFNEILQKAFPVLQQVANCKLRSWLPEAQAGACRMDGATLVRRRRRRAHLLRGLRDTTGEPSGTGERDLVRRLEGSDSVEVAGGWRAWGEILSDIARRTTV